MQNRWFRVPVLAFAMLFSETIAFAQPVANDAAALKAEGDRAMDTLRYEDALAKYEAAYRAKADPALLYNQGRALEGLGRFPDALDKLRAFKAAAPKDLLSRLGEALDKNIDELATRVATVSIKVEPAGASIRLGDRILGTAPLEKLRVNAGKAHLEISKEGFFSETLDVELKGAQDNPLTISLSPRDSRATLIVKSPIAGARVNIDCAPRGQGPAEVRQLPGPHIVRVEQDGYQRAESTIDLAPLEKRPLEVPLFKRPITQEWWLWTSIGVALTGAGVGIGLALTLE
ncbi:MAG: PEGA domain-containing protein, partial [Myxococcales bacterium]|nr:PEGA domain-containing protein [Myxococcales bacterium]